MANSICTDCVAAAAAASGDCEKAAPLYSPALSSGEGRGFGVGLQGHLA